MTRIASSGYLGQRASLTSGLATRYFPSPEFRSEIRCFQMSSSWGPCKSCVSAVCPAYSRTSEVRGHAAVLCTCAELRSMRLGVSIDVALNGVQALLVLASTIATHRIVLLGPKLRRKRQDCSHFVSLRRKRGVHGGGSDAWLYCHRFPRFVLKIAPASGDPQTIAPSLGFTPVAWSSAGPLASWISLLPFVHSVVASRDRARVVSSDG